MKDRRRPFSFCLIFTECDWITSQTQTQYKSPWCFQPLLIRLDRGNPIHPTSTQWKQRDFHLKLTAFIHSRASFTYITHTHTPALISLLHMYSLFIRLDACDVHANTSRCKTRWYKENEAIRGRESEKSRWKYVQKFVWKWSDISTAEHHHHHYTGEGH